MPTLTEVVHAELGRVRAVRRCCQRAEIATVLRLSAAVDRRDGRLVVVADLAEGVAARRLHTLITAAFGYPVRLQSLPAPRPGRPDRYRVSVGGADAAELARRVGAVDGHGRLVRGLPPAVIGGPACDAAAVWRAAVLTSGELTWPGHRIPLQVYSPDQVVALALVGAARRLGVSARGAETHGRWRLTVPDHAQVVTLLEGIGAAAGARAWQHSAPPPSARRPPAAVGCDGANRQRAAAAGLTAAARIRAALAVLGDDAPAHLLDTGRLRLTHPHATLEQLGALADPPMTKDAIAGRIRRLIALADARTATTKRPTQHPTPAADVLDPSGAAGRPAASAAAGDFA